MDDQLLERHLVHIEDSIALLRAHADLDRLATDPVQRAFVIHTLQVAIQAAIDVASMVASRRNLGVANTNRELFEKLAADGWLSTGSVDLWRRIVAFRNIVVHQYLGVRHEVVEAIARNHLGDLEGFVASIRERLHASPDA